MDLIKGESLKPGGKLYIVTQIGVPLGPLLEQQKVKNSADESIQELVSQQEDREQNTYDSIELISDGRFALWCAQKASSSSSTTSNSTKDNKKGKTEVIDNDDDSTNKKSKKKKIKKHKLPIEEGKEEKEERKKKRTKK